MKSKILFSLLAFTCLFQTIQAQDAYYDDNDDSDYYKIPNLELIDSVVGKYRIFMSGENHTYAMLNNSIELQLLKYLHEHRGVKDLVIELGFARGYMIDQYINDDTTFYEQLVRTTGYPYLKYYRDLRAWNQTLPDSQRVHVHGIDIERFPDDAPVLMARLLKKDSAVPENIQFLRDVIRSYAEYKQAVVTNNEDIIWENNFGFNFFQRSLSDAKTIDSMLAEYDRTKDDFRQYLGKAFTLFDLTMQSLKGYRYYKSLFDTPQQYVYRERFMMNNLLKLLDEDSNRCVYGQFGRCHIGLDQVMNDCDWWDHSPLAKRINDSRYKGQVMNFAITYPNSGFYEGMDDDLDVSEYRDSMDGSHCKLFAVNADDSALSANYQYMIIAAVKGFNYVKSKDKLMSYSYGAVEFRYGLSKFNLTNLNSAIDPLNKKGFDMYLKTYEFNFQSNNDVSITGFNLRVYGAQNFTNSRYSYKLNGFSVMDYVGVSPYISRNFGISAMVLIGYTRLSLRTKDDSASYSFSPAFNKINKQQFNNGAFAIGAGLNMKLAIGGLIALTANAQVVGDPSSKYWRRVEGGQNTLDKASPKTSMFNYSLTLGLALMMYGE